MCGHCSEPHPSTRLKEQEDSVSSERSEAIRIQIRKLTRSELGDEKRETDGEGRDEASDVLLRGAHDDREHEQERAKGLDEESADDARAGESVVRTLSEPVAAAPPFSLSAFLVSEERDVPGNMQLTSPAAAMPAAY